MKFVADGMLGRLTRWLRLAGQDVVCINDYSVSPKHEDEALLNLARKSSRVLITGDTDLHLRALGKNIKSVLIEEVGDVAEQLAKVSEKVEEPMEVTMEDSRCPVCNGELESVAKPSISEDVPGPVLENNDKFWRCEGCGKVYWPGSHWEKIADTVEKYERLKG